MTKSIISVIIPTFEPEDYILDCLTSLSKQTMSPELFEVILILNGDKDPYFEFIQSILRKTDGAINIKLLHTEKKGVSNARNLGLEQSVGEYITFLDDDDFLSPNYLNDLYETILALKIDQREGVIACTNFKTFDGSIYGEDYLSRAFKKCSVSKYSLIKCRHFLSGISGKLIPFNVIGDVRFRNELTIGEDSVFLFELSNKLNRMVLTQEDVYYVRRIRPGSARTTKRNRKERFSIFFKLSSVYTKIYFKSPFSYSFLLYATRMLAAFRTLMKTIFSNIKD